MIMNKNRGIKKVQCDLIMFIENRNAYTVYLLQTYENIVINIIPAFWLASHQKGLYYLNFDIS